MREPEITFKRGSKVDFPSLKKRFRKLSGAAEDILPTAVEIEPTLIVQEPVVVPVTVPASTATGAVQARVRSLRSLKTPSKRKSTRPRRSNLKKTLVRDLKKREKELLKGLREVRADLKSLGLKTRRTR